MKKTYIEPNIEVLTLNMSTIMAGSYFGQDNNYFDGDINSGEVDAE